MSLQDYLRHIDPSEQALNLLCLRHPGSKITGINSQSRYLHLILNDDQGTQIMTWLCVDEWLEKMECQLPDIPWQEVPLNYLARWLHSFNLAFDYKDRIWHVAEMNTMPLPPEKAILLPSEPCKLLCADWPLKEQNSDVSKSIDVKNIPLVLKIVLGYTHLPLAELVGLTVGDIILIKRMDIHLSVSDRPLFQLSYYPHQEVIVEEQSNKEDMMDSNEGRLDEWGSLPVEMEFVLDGQQITLSELDKIQTGISLSLTADAEKNIKIYLNKKHFAGGELVALEDGTLAVEINSVNPGLISDTEQRNAE